MAEYIPNPYDLTDVVLSDDLMQLGELIAKNVHEVWAKGRLDEGWTYGDAYSRAEKKTPCLVPYECLPESERDYDRNTAMETLRLITKLGFTVSKKEDDKHGSSL